MLLESEDLQLRESIWSVRASWQSKYLILFGLQLAICFGLVVWYEITQNTEDSAIETFFSIGDRLSPFIIVIAAESLLLLEIFIMLSERYLLKRYKEGRAEGRAEGLAEGLAEAQVKIDAWNKRRMEAEAKGEAFDEPLPKLNGKK